MFDLTVAKLEYGPDKSLPWLSGRFHLYSRAFPELKRDFRSLFEISGVFLVTRRNGNDVGKRAEAKCSEVRLINRQRDVSR